MSRLQSTRRLRLLAGSSLALAGLSAAASLSLTPTAAYATDECTPLAGSGTLTDGAGGVSDPTLNGAATDTFECTVSTYATGITYSSSGELIVRKTNSGTTTVTANGVNLTGAGANPVTWTSTVGGVTGGTTTSGPVIEVLSGSGAIAVNTAGVTGSNATITHGIRAISTGGGAITVTTTGSVSATSATGDGVTAGGTAAIEAISTGGAGAVSVTTAGASGRLYGVRAQASGTGALTISTGTSSASANSSTGLAGISATTGTGLLTITGTGSGGAGTGVLINAGGNVNFTGMASGSQYGIDVANVAAGTTTTLNLLGTRSGFGSGGVNATTGGLAAIRGQGAGTLVVNIVGAQAAMNLNFTGMAARVDVNVKTGGAWAPVSNTSTVIPNGKFSINIEAGAGLFAGIEDSGGGNILEPATVLTFSDPAMVLNNAGYIVIGPDIPSTNWQLARQEAELRLVGLNEFRHSGTILLGGAGYPGVGATIQGVKIEDSDSWYDDILTFQGGTWIGEGGKIVFDVDTNRTQVNCNRAAVTNDLSAADCVRIVNAEVEGQTLINIIQIVPGDRGRLTQQIMDEGILLVDAPGSTVTAENFALDPGMRDYNAASDSLDKGLYQYVLLFDDTANQYRLFGTLSGAAYQLPMAATAAQGLWRLSAASWFERQADMRGSEQPGGGVWLRAAGEQTDRDITSASTLGGLPYAVDNTHKINSYAVTGGIDLITAGEGDMAYVVGLMGGYAHGDVDYEASTNTQAMDAWTGGVYASFVSGGLYVDAAINANNAILDTDAPGFNLLPVGTIVSSRLVTTGGQVEAGWRLPFGQGLFAEPLAGISYVQSQLEDVQVRPDDLSRPGLVVSYDDPASLRAGVGGRLGMDRDLGAVRAQVSLMGRVWKEMDGQNTATIHNNAFATDPDIRVTDDFSGQVSELALGAALHSPGGAVSGFVNLGGKFGDDYRATNASAGVRVQW